VDPTADPNPLLCSSWWWQQQRWFPALLPWGKWSVLDIARRIQQLSNPIIVSRITPPSRISSIPFRSPRCVLCVVCACVSFVEVGGFVFFVPTAAKRGNDVQATVGDDWQVNFFFFLPLFYISLSLSLLLTWLRMCARSRGRADEMRYEKRKHRAARWHAPKSGLAPAPLFLTDLGTEGG